MSDNLDRVLDAWIALKQAVTVKGDVEGHEFRGNQYTSGSSGGSSDEGERGSSSHGNSGSYNGNKSNRTYEKNVEGRNKKLSDISEGDVISHNGKDYDVVGIRKVGGKQNRHDVIVKPHGEPLVKMVEGVGLNKGKQVPLYQSRALTFYNVGGSYSADNFDFKS